MSYHTCLKLKNESHALKSSIFKREQHVRFKFNKDAIWSKINVLVNKTRV